MCALGLEFLDNARKARRHLGIIEFQYASAHPNLLIIRACGGARSRHILVSVNSHFSQDGKTQHFPIPEQGGDHCDLRLRIDHINDRLATSAQPRPLLATVHRSIAPVYYRRGGLHHHTTHHQDGLVGRANICLLYTSPSPRDRQKSRMPSSA